MTKSEANSFINFQDIAITNFRCPNLQRDINSKKMQRAITRKKKFLTFFSPGYLLIILYQLFKFVQSF